MRTFPNVPRIITSWFPRREPKVLKSFTVTSFSRRYVPAGSAFGVHGTLVGLFPGANAGWSVAAVGEGVPLANLLADAGVAKSRGEARRLISNGGVYLNNIKASESDQAVTLDQSIDGQFLVIRKGKKNYHLVRVE